MSHTGSGTELNLVPFIDLLSTLVIFLVSTAVWTQIAAISLMSDPNQSNRAGQAIHYDHLSIRLTKDGFLVRVNQQSGKSENSSSNRMKKADGNYPIKALLDWTKEFRRKNQLATVSVDSDDSVSYAAVVQVLDAVKASGFKAVDLGG